MKQSFILLFFILLNSFLFAQDSPDADYIRANYDKQEYKIPMRDGIKLHTVVYSPKDKSKKYPILMQRTCYGAKPYGEEYKTRIGPSTHLMRDGYIFVYQDVRGRWMSEGTFDNMRPHIAGNKPKNKQDIDESSDTYDTVDWLIKKLKGHNGKVGQWGISYPGFYTAAAIPEAHPALVASSPQAPISDFFFDDFHHMGAYLQSYTMTFPVFGVQKDKPTGESWYADKWKGFEARKGSSDAYEYYLGMGPLHNITKEFYPDNFFWKELIEHPNYDEVWQSKNILPHLKGVNHAVMTVGGWFDAEDLYGPLNIYKNLEKNNPSMQNTIVMGPWSHGDWAREKGVQAVNHIYFGDSISTFYQKEIEMPFFNYHLKGEKQPTLPEAFMFDTGIKEWKKFDQWPPENTKNYSLSLGEGETLNINKRTNPYASFSYVSDPNKPVPYTSEIEATRFTPRPFMTDDQRHASRRTDVLTFETAPLGNDLTLMGEIMVNLIASISTTDADFVVKLIDVYPPDAEPNKITPAHVSMGNYQQLVRSEVFRGRFRKSFVHPEPFVPNEKTEVDFPLQDILHTFKKGHKVMIQIHSTWFPYIDRNPQTYVPNIYKAKSTDFVKSTITIHGGSTITIGKAGSLMDKFEAMKKP